MMDQLRIAWAAGFLDGEGCITVLECTARDCSRKQYQGLIDAAQTKRAPLDELVQIFGGKVRPYRGEFYWRLYNAKAAVAIQQLIPYLIGKRLQAELLMEFAALKGVQGRRRSEAVMLRQAEICATFRVLNARRVRHAERLSERAPQHVLRMMR